MDVRRRPTRRGGVVNRVGIDEVRPYAYYTMATGRVPFLYDDGSWQDQPQGDEVWT